MPLLAVTALRRMATFRRGTWLRILVPFLGALALGWWLEISGEILAAFVLVASLGGLLRFGLWERRQTELIDPTTAAMARASLRRHTIVAGIEAAAVGLLLIVTIAE